jgi:DNA ligase-1
MADIRKIYKRDTKGKLRIWFMEQDGSKHRTWAGLVDGAITPTDWTQCEATNVGRANERNPEQQAAFEIEANYKKKLSGEYHETIEDTDQGAHFFLPMLAEIYSKFQPGYVQPKLDGGRCIARHEGMKSRKGKPLPGAAHLYEILVPHFRANPSLLIDGELYNHEYKDDFNRLMGLIKRGKATPEQLEECVTKVEYHVYDLPSHPGTFSQRHAALAELVERINHPQIILVDTAYINEEQQYDKVHGICLGAGYEGSIFRLDAPYENKRTYSLLKRKEKQDAEFDLVCVERGLGNWSNAAKTAFFKVPGAPINVGDYFVEADNKLQIYSNGIVPSPDAVRASGAGIKGSMARGVELLNEQHDLVTVEFFEYTPDGVPRFPIATKFHGSEKI